MGDLLSSRQWVARGMPLPLTISQDLSTSELQRIIANAAARFVHLFSVLSPLLLPVGRLLGRPDNIDGLMCSPQIDSSAAREQLGGPTATSVEEGVGSMVKGVQRC